MPKKRKLTCNKINYFLKDEKKATREYREYGLPRLSKQEAEHAKLFKRLKKQCKA